jgi:DNA mismatch repair protein MutH
MMLSEWQDQQINVFELLRTLFHMNRIAGRNLLNIIQPAPPASIPALLQRSQEIMGMSLGDIASHYAITLPSHRTHAKGWIGQCLEYVLGATSGSLPQPDFPHLGIELKTIPIDDSGKPLESTYLCIAPMTFTPGLNFSESLAWQKIRHVLWIPYEGHKNLSFAQRRIGEAILWQPSAQDREILEQDWEEHLERLRMGDAWQRCARFGQYLQLRPKAANGSVRRTAIQVDGTLGPSLPLGFYLRTSFTKKILQSQTSFL